MPHPALALDREIERLAVVAGAAPYEAYWISASS